VKINLPRPDSKSGLGSQFDAFLFAVVGEDRNGTALCVVSVLARMGLDPWAEAASLAAVSGEMAAQRLTPLLAALPQPILQQTSPETTAVRLIALLPRRLMPNIHPVAQESGVAPAAPPRSVINVILIAIYMILSLGIQVAIARRGPPVCTNIPVTSAAPSQLPPTISNK
jgi:hypothetical protein